MRTQSPKPPRPSAAKIPPPSLSKCGLCYVPAMKLILAAILLLIAGPAMAQSMTVILPEPGGAYLVVPPSGAYADPPAARRRRPRRTPGRPSTWCCRYPKDRPRGALLGREAVLPRAAGAGAAVEDERAEVKWIPKKTPDTRNS